MENETSDAKVPIVERHKEIDLIQSCINRMAQNSFQVKGWTVALFAVILALLPEKVESTNKFFLGVVLVLGQLFPGGREKLPQNLWMGTSGKGEGKP